MKTRTLIFKWLLFLVGLLTSCKSVYVIQKSDHCSTPANKLFTDHDVSEMRIELNNILDTNEFQFTKKEALLELIIKKRDNAKFHMFVEEYFNRPILEFKKIALTLTQEQKNIVDLLKSYSDFKLYPSSRSSRQFGNCIVGYVNSEEDVLRIDQCLKEQNFDLISSNLHWQLNPMKKKYVEGEKYFLVATENDSDKKLEKTNKHLKRIKVLFDRQYFKYAIKVSLNEKGLEKYKNEIKASSKILFAAIVDKRITAIQRIKVGEQNEITLFGFKSFDQAIEYGRRIKNRSSLVEIKKVK